MIKEEIAKLVENSIKKVQKKKLFPEFDIPKILVEYPEEKTHGDYATNVALVITKQIKKNPLEIAKILVNQLINLSVNQFEKIEVREPGFINFFLSREYLQKQVTEILKRKQKYGSPIHRSARLKKKVLIEFISANPTSPLHIGNGRGAFFGDSLANVLEKAGYKVIREYYINDAKVNTQIKLLGQTGVGEGITYLNDYLQQKIQNSKSKIQNYKSKFKNKEKLYGKVGYLLAQKIQKDTRNFIEKKLKIKFDHWASEEDLYKKNKVNKIFNWLKNKNLVYQKKGAWWIKTSEFDDSQDWVVIRSKGEGGQPTYLLSDIAYHKYKFDRNFQKIINIWGADHQGHVSKIKAVAKMLRYKGSLDILISQIMRLKKGKISKRKGEIVTLEDLIHEVGLDVARFLYLTKSLQSQMEFNLELAKKQSHMNPVFYIQYAQARMCSILKKADIKKLRKSAMVNLLTHSRELDLIKQLIRFPEIIEDTAKDYQVQRIPQYGLDLATVFHRFYEDCRVISEHKNLTQARLGLISATKTVLENTLNLMGVLAPEKM